MQEALSKPFYKIDIGKIQFSTDEMSKHLIFKITTLDPLCMRTRIIYTQLMTSEIINADNSKSTYHCLRKR